MYIIVQVVYKDEIPLIIYQNPDARLVLSVTGKGSEPQIMFDRNMIHFTPVFPFSEGSDVEVTIQNPLNYPVEIYSLEFDQQYQEEENVCVVNMHTITCVVYTVHVHVINYMYVQLYMHK